MRDRPDSYSVTGSQCGAAFARTHRIIFLWSIWHWCCPLIAQQALLSTGQCATAL